MNLQTITKRVAVNLSYEDASGDPIDADISETDIINWVNDRYLEDLVPEYSDLRPEFYSNSGYARNYAVSGVVDAATTGYTLVTTSPIFTNNMVNAYVFNNDLTTSARILSYTDSSTVVLDTEIGSDWTGDSIYVMTGIYTFGGDATDTSVPTWIGIKYTASAADWTHATKVEDEDFNHWFRGRDRDGLANQVSPEYMFDTVMVDNVPTSAIVVKPYNWTEIIPDAIYMRYTAMPAAMSADADVPRLPKGFHTLLVKGATADGFRKLGRLAEAREWEAMYQMDRRKLMRHKISERRPRTVRFERPRSTFIAFRRNG